jgi:hypothetical protein
MLGGKKEPSGKKPRGRAFASSTRGVGGLLISHITVGCGDGDDDDDDGDGDGMVSMLLMLRMMVSVLFRVRC